MSRAARPRGTVGTAKYANDAKGRPDRRKNRFRTIGRYPVIRPPERLMPPRQNKYVAPETGLPSFFRVFRVFRGWGELKVSSLGNIFVRAVSAFWDSALRASGCRHCRGRSGRSCRGSGGRRVFRWTSAACADRPRSFSPSGRPHSRTWSHCCERREKGLRLWIRVFRKSPACRPVGQ
jgi:hypothetical protein